MKKFKIISISILVLLYIVTMIAISYVYTERPVLCKTLQKEYVLQSGTGNEVSVILKNRVLQTVSSEENYYISYHLYNAQKKLVSFDNERTAIAGSLPKGKTLEQQAIISPLEKGEYYIAVDVVQEGVRWYTPKYIKKSYTKLIVQ